MIINQNKNKKRYKERYNNLEKETYDSVQLLWNFNKFTKSFQEFENTLPATEILEGIYYLHKVI